MVVELMLGVNSSICADSLTLQRISHKDKIPLTFKSRKYCSHESHLLYHRVKQPFCCCSDISLGPPLVIPVVL
ncbi:hypothetical protein GDO81_021932 [Engystomops pustulosus]|uniref:Uncharacterized protein n=1 Tax=Engystomops pustulosus TaxID=76066 RepID=A0AAV6ZP02_ENGPU|nr:hypothetical protein GDO81_021932 [Engystomops pustulosus]